MAARPNAAAIAVLLPALALGIASALSLAAAATALPTDRAVEAMRSRADLDPAIVQETVRGQLRAADWFEPVRYRTAAVAALAALPAERRAGALSGKGANAETLTRRALAAAPASPYNWARLADLRLAAGDRAGANRFWQMSVLTGRYVPGLMGPRLTIGFGLFPTKDEALVDLLSDQVRVAAAADPRGLAEAAETRLAIPFVRAVLADDAELLRNFGRGQDQLRYEDSRRADALRRDAVRRARIGA